MKDITEEQLIQLAAAGDTRACTFFYSKYRGYVRSIVLSKLRISADDADDIIQDSMIRIFKNLGSFRNNKCAVKSWIYEITKNAIIDYIRKDSFRSDGIESYIKDTGIPSYNIYDKINTKEATSLLMKELNSMRISDRVKESVLMLVDGYSYEEVQNRMNVSSSTARSSLFRVRMALKEGPLMEYRNI